MNTQFLQKAIAPSKQAMSSPLERWAYNLVNTVLVGGSTAVTTSIGLVIVHGSGVQDVPGVNLHIIGTLFLAGSVGKFFMFLSQGLPALRGTDADQEPPPAGGPPAAMLVALLLLLGSFRAVAQEPSPLAFTNVAVKAWSGYQYDGNTSDSQALLGADVDLWSFRAGRLGKLDLAVGTQMTIDDGSSAVRSLSLRPTLIKNLDQTQIDAFAGVGRQFADAPRWYAEFGCDVSYNLYRAQNWFTFVGSGISFRVIDGEHVDYFPCVRAGIAF